LNFKGDITTQISISDVQDQFNVKA